MLQAMAAVSAQRRRASSLDGQSVHRCKRASERSKELAPNNMCAARRHSSAAQASARVINWRGGGEQAPVEQVGSNRCRLARRACSAIASAEVVAESPQLVRVNIWAAAAAHGAKLTSTGAQAAAPQQQLQHALACSLLASSIWQARKLPPPSSASDARSPEGQLRKSKRGVVCGE